MSRVEQVLQRTDGSEVKIVAHTICSFLEDTPSVETFVLWRESSKHDWQYASEQPHPNWRSMSVDEYIKHGRPKMLQVTTFGERVRVAQLLRSQLDKLH